MPLLHIVPGAREIEGREFALQSIDQRAMAGPIVKRLIRADSPCAIATAAVEGYRLAAAGEPGPVMSKRAKRISARRSPRPGPSLQRATPGRTGRAHRRIRSGDLARTQDPPLPGRWCSRRSAEVRALADATGAAIATTTSGRGVISEDEACVVVRDPGMQDLAALAGLVERADLVVAVGCKFSHNGAAGFRLRLPREKLVTINAAGPSKNYPAMPACHGGRGNHDRRHPASARAETGRQRRLGTCRASRTGARLRCASRRMPASSLVTKARERRRARSYADLRAALPDDAIVVTDSGYHQMSVRRHYTVRSPHGLIVPTNFQSMGYALPAAIGAALGAPSRRVVAVVGDGGMLMSGLELATAARERIPLTVVVFNDRRLPAHPQSATCRLWRESRHRYRGAGARGAGGGHWRRLPAGRRRRDRSRPGRRRPRRVAVRRRGSARGFGRHEGRTTPRQDACRGTPIPARQGPLAAASPVRSLTCPRWSVGARRHAGERHDGRQQKSFR